MFSFLVVIFLIHHPTSEGKDLLHLFRPKPDLPRELNDFLTDVQEHQRDFAFIRNAARNQKKYEKSYQESHDLLAEDIDDQMTINPDYNRKSNELDQSEQRLPYADNSVYSGFESPNKFSHLYPEERYSKFIHSPIRLRRELEDSYRNREIQANSNADYGNVQRPEAKLPGNQMRDNKNRYHTGFLVGVEEDAEESDETYPAVKGKREVEISIKSDGKLVKRIEESEDVPKSIVLNIKSDNSAKAANEAVETNEGPSSKAPRQENSGPNSAPTNGDSIPSFITSSASQSKNIGVPINAIPADNRISNGRVVAEPERPPFSLPEVAKNEDFKPKLEQPYWPAGNSHMAKSIDLAQGNINSNYETIKDNQDLGLGMNGNDKKEEFDKVQGLLVDTNNAKPKEKYWEKRKRRFEPSQQMGELPQSAHWETQDGDIHMDPNQTYEVREHSTKDVLVIPVDTTTECTKMPEKEEEAEEIGEAIAQQIIKEEENTECGATTPEEEEFKIVRHHKTTTECFECDQKPQDEEEEIDIIHEKPHPAHNQHHHYAEEAAPEGIVKRSGRRKFRIHKPSLRKHRKHRIHLNQRPFVSGYEGTEDQAVGDQPQFKRKRKRVHPRLERQAFSEYYDLNQHYQNPEDAFDYLPSYQRRSLKSLAYEFDPHLIPDVGTHEEEAVEQMENRNVGMKEESKKTTEDEDITYEEVQGGDSLELEEANSSKNEHENDRLRDNLQKEFVPLLDQLRVTTENLAQSDSSRVIDDMLLEANQMLASAHGHGSSQKKKTEKRRKKTNQDSGGGRGRKKRRRHSQSKEHINKSPLDQLETLNAKPAITNNPVVKRSDTVESPNTPEQSQNKPLTAQEKQNIFLRYNPDFQRWPRFVQDDNQYQTLMRNRARENQQRYLRNARNGNHFPIPNEYFLDPRPEFVKRQEPSTVEASASSEATAASETSAGETSAAVSTTASSVSEEGSSSTLSSEAADGASSTSPTIAAMEAESSSTANLFEMAAQESATLPESAQNILQTANSDIFENTSLPGLGGLGDVNSPLGAPQTVQSSTEFHFTTKAEDLTSNSQCDNVTQKHVESCDEESAKHSAVPITSVLPLLPDAASETALNMTKDQFLDLDEILMGDLPKHIVSEALANAHGSVRPGLRAGRFNMNILLTGFNNSAETSLILTEMTNLMKKLKYRSTCQILPSNLRTYVKILTKNEMDDPLMKLKEMNEIDFDEHQSNYVFHYAQSDNIQEKAGVLKELLNKYDNLPANCKERAEPVKEYIETHLAMIEHMGEEGKKKGASGPPTTPSQEPNTSSAKPKAKKDIDSALSEDASDLLEGMENEKSDKVIEGLDKAKREAEYGQFVFRELSTSTSPQFGKLAHAVRNFRNRREVMQRIGEIYGRSQRKSAQTSELFPARGDEEKGFEAPPVINF